MSKLEKLRGHQNWERRIWEAVITYVNANDRHGFESLVTLGLDWIGADESDMESCRDLQGTTLETLATKYQPYIAGVLTWLSDPLKHAALAIPGAEFLRRFGRDFTMHVDGNARFENDDDPLVYEWPDQIGSVISPVCKFILDQIERHDVNGEPLRDVIPVFQCEREGCNQLFLAERVGRARFCSGACRAKVHQSSMTKEERAERMRKYRQGLKDRAAAKQNRTTTKTGAIMRSANKKGRSKSQ